MNILQIHNFYVERGGESQVLLNEKRNLENNGHSVFQLTADNKNINNYFQNKYLFFAKLKILLAKNTIDIVHIHNIHYIIGSGIYKYISNKGIAIVQTCHNFRFLCPNGLFLDNNFQICELCSKGNFLFSIYKKCYKGNYTKSLALSIRTKYARRSVIKFVDQFVMLTNFSKEKFTSLKVSEERISIKPNFLYKNKLVPSNDGQYALYIGRLPKDKNVGFLISAFSNLHFKLKIAGTGECMEELKLQATNNIEFMGFVDGSQKETLLANCSFIIIPSKSYDMFPVSILEASKYSKPALVPAHGGFQEIVINNVTGYLFKPNNIDALKNAIEHVVRNKKYLSLGVNAYNRLNEFYNKDLNYNTLINIYEKAILNKLNHPRGYL